MAPYDPQAIEARFQSAWKEVDLFRTDTGSSRPKYYCLEMFMYPSGRIHMGHVRNYTIGDVVARYQRMRGATVLHPMGFDAFGLPAENAAIKGHAHPADWTGQNVAYMKEQLDRLGLSYDWEREVRTCEPDYYRWNQWIFLKLFERGLCYKAQRTVNWCPDCATVLANEQVEGGLCWRCHNTVTQKEMAQWFLRITDYAQQLLDGHEQLAEWPQEVLAMQRNWIGRSEGAFVEFSVEGTPEKIRVFTTRIDTIYGATFLVLAPEHPAVDRIASQSQKAEIEAFRSRMRAQSTHDRTTSKEKLGVATGAFAVNPFSGEKVPIFLANFVLMDYGTGAIMSVPAHDQRDFEFAKAYSLPIRVVIQSGGLNGATLTEAASADGVLEQSGPYTGLPNREAMRKMASDAQAKGFGEATVNYRLKDWGISRQRYWGTPIPIVYCQKCGTVPVAEDQLPVLLPRDVPFTGKGESPLARCASFVEVPCPKCGAQARRETDTMDTFVDSSWYMLRFTSPKETNAPFDSAQARRWAPVDFYIGGIEHATMHLIYCRFVTMALRDMGLVPFGEPAKRLMCQGMVIKDGAKMSKSIGNIVDPDAMVERYGADAVRLNILFLSPPWDQLDWKESGVEGTARFLNRFWTLTEEQAADLSSGATALPENGPAADLRRKTHQTIQRITEELGGRLKINTAIAALMELLNLQQSFASRYQKNPEERFALKESLEATTCMLSPFAPHIADALWELLGHKGFLADGPWPGWDAAVAREDTVTLAVQVNGKLRDQVTVAADATDAESLAAAKASEKVKMQLEGKTLVKEVVVKGRLVSLVVK